MKPILPRAIFPAFPLAAACVLLTAAPRVLAQAAYPLQLSGVYTVDSGVSSTNAAFVAVKLDASKNIYLLLDEQDGVRVLKLNPAGTGTLASAHIGAAGDHGLAMTLDSSGNVYVAGQTASGALTSTGAESFNGTQNGFLLQLTSALGVTSLTATGGSTSAATSVAVAGGKVYVTGTIQGHDLPVTGDAIFPTFPNSSTTTGFFEIFASNGAALAFSTYLGGANGNTFPQAVAADSSGNAYVTGYDTATGFPTLNALQPEIIGTSDMFLTKLSQAAGLEFSTQLGTNGGTVAGAAIALSPSGTILVAANATALGLPLTNALEPVPAAASYAMLMSFAADGSAVNFSTMLGSGTVRSVASISSSSIWISGSIGDLGGFPITDDLQHLGNGFAAQLDGSGNLLFSTRLGAITAYDSTAAQASTSLAAVAVASDGTVAAAGTWTLLAASGKLANENFDLPYVAAPTVALPGRLSTAAAPSACSSAAPSCSAAFVAELGVAAGASLALSVDTLPNLTLRNTGTATVTVTGVSAGGYTVVTDCTQAALAAGGACNIVAAGNGPGTLTVTTSGGSYNFSLTGAAVSANQNAVEVQPKELLFPASASAESQQQQVTVSNLTSSAQVVEVGNDGSEFTLADDTAATACVDNEYPFYTANPDSACTLLALFNDSATYDVQDGGKIGYATLQTSGEPVNAVSYYGYQLAAGSHDNDGGLVYSALDVDFGTQYVGGLHPSRGIVVTNATSSAVLVPFISASAADPNFALTDECPATLAAHTSCVLTIAYASAVASTDSITLVLPGSETLTLTGTTLLQPGAGGLTADPSITVSPASLTFGAVGVGDSTVAQSVTVANSGSVAAAITVATTAGFTQTNTCGGSVPANGNCTITVTYTPVSLGVVKGQLTVTPSGASPVAIALAGGGTADIAFATALAGTQTTHWISQGSYTGSISASVQGPYQVAILNGYNYTAPPKIVFAATASGACTDNCYVGLRAMPAAAGVQSGTLTVTQGSVTTTTPLTGTALFQPPAVLSAYSLSFGSVQQHLATAPQVVAVTNDGSSAATISGIAVTAGFVESNNCGSTLAAGASCAITVTFTPGTPGTFAGTLSVTAGGAALAAALMGTSTADPAGITFSPAFLTVASPGAAYSATITVTNTASVSRIVSGVELSVPYSQFSESNNCATLAANATCTIQIKATSVPAAVAATYDLSVAVTAGGTETTEVLPVTLLPASGGDSTATVQVSPGSLSFAPAAVGQYSNPEYLTITNETTAAQPIAFSSPQSFSVDTTTCATLAAGASCTVAVRFIPSSAGFLSGTTGSGSLAAIALSGYGIPSTSLAAPAYPPLVQPIDASSLTVTNAGSAALTISAIRGSAITANACPRSLAAGTSCVVSVLTSQGLGCGDSCTTETSTTPVTVVSSADSSPDAYQLPQTLTGAQPTALGAIALSAESITFPQTALNGASTYALQLQSTGGAAVTFSIAAAGDFKESDNCAGSVAAQDTCLLTVTFSPTAAGFRAGSLYLETSAGSETVTLAGNGPSTGVASTSTTLSAASYSIAAGSSGQLSARVTSSDNTTPSGTVTFRYGTLTIGSATLSGGVGSYTATASVPAGTYDLTASYSGDGTHAASTSPAVPITVTSTTVATTTRLTASPTSAAAGSPVTLTATVTRNVGSGTPGGQVTFLYGSTVLGSASLSGGVAAYTLATAGYTPGQYGITASYAGDTGDQPSTSSAVTVTIKAALSAITTVLSNSPASPVQGSNVTLTAVVSGSGFVPTGSVTFYYAGSAIGSLALTNGAGSLTASTSGLAAGQYSVTARYSGSSTAAASASNADVITLRSSTSTALMIAPSSALPGQKVTLTATARRTAGTGTPAGNVTFFADGEQIGSATLSGGIATLVETIPSVPPGTYQVTAQYAGSNSDGSSTSAAVNFTVQ